MLGNSVFRSTKAKGKQPVYAEPEPSFNVLQLPREILLIIFSYIRHRKTLEAISNTCIVFNVCVTPILYREIKFQSTLSYAQFLQTLTRSSNSRPFAKYIQVVDLSGSSDPHDRFATSPVRAVIKQQSYTSVNRGEKAQVMLFFRNLYSPLLQPQQPAVPFKWALIAHNCGNIVGSGSSLFAFCRRKAHEVVEKPTSNPAKELVALNRAARLGAFFTTAGFTNPAIPPAIYIPPAHIVQIQHHQQVLQLQLEQLLQNDQQQLHGLQNLQQQQPPLIPPPVTAFHPHILQALYGVQDNQNTMQATMETFAFNEFQLDEMDGLGPDGNTEGDNITDNANNLLPTALNDQFDMDADDAEVGNFDAFSHTGANAPAADFQPGLLYPMMDMSVPANRHSQASSSSTVQPTSSTVIVTEPTVELHKSGNEQEFEDLLSAEWNLEVGNYAPVYENSDESLSRRLQLLQRFPLSTTTTDSHPRVGSYFRSPPIKVVSAGSLEELANHCPGLKSLNLANSQVTPDTFIVETKEYVSTLYHEPSSGLTLRKVSPSGAIRRLLDKCEGLVNLDLAGCNWVTVDTVNGIIKKRNSLKALNLMACSRLPPSLQRLFVVHDSSELRDLVVQATG
ncbi:UNVERIFIED_CONTAM: hypothetical protein HDU68_012666 [Siphonaria sp. JEL0065]|nr:hypothetical protein HDU68_012666 [Siphonaria sp. JEL0065]